MTPHGAAATKGSPGGVSDWGQGENPFPRRVVQQEMGRRAAGLRARFTEVIQQTELPSQTLHWDKRQNSPVCFKPGANIRYLIY